MAGNNAIAWPRSAGIWLTLLAIFPLSKFYNWMRKIRLPLKNKNRLQTSSLETAGCQSHPYQGLFTLQHSVHESHKRWYRVGLGDEKERSVPPLSPVLTHHRPHWLSSCYQSVCISPALHGLRGPANMLHTQCPITWEKTSQTNCHYAAVCYFTWEMQVLTQTYLTVHQGLEGL